MNYKEIGKLLRSNYFLKYFLNRVAEYLRFYENLDVIGEWKFLPERQKKIIVKQ